MGYTQKEIDQVCRKTFKEDTVGRPFNRSSVLQTWHTRNSRTLECRSSVYNRMVTDGLITRKKVKLSFITSCGYNYAYEIKLTEKGKAHKDYKK